MNFLLPGLGPALHGRVMTSLLYPTLFGFFITLSAYLGYFLQPESTLATLMLLFLLAATGSIHEFYQSRYKRLSHKNRQTKLALGFHTSFWLLLIAGLLFFRQPWLGFDIYYVQGSSMLPTLKPSDIIVVEIIPHEARLQERDIVVIDMPKTSKMLVKRYIPIKPGDTADQSSLFLLGDNLVDSLDSRLLGPIPRKRVIGKASWILISDFKPSFKKIN